MKTVFSTELDRAALESILGYQEASWTNQMINNLERYIEKKKSLGQCFKVIGAEVGSTGANRVVLEDTKGFKLRLYCYWWGNWKKSRKSVQTDGTYR